MAAQGNSSEQRLGLGKDALSNILLEKIMSDALVDFVVALLVYVHGKHQRSCRDGQFT